MIWHAARVSVKNLISFSRKGEKKEWKLLLRTGISVIFFKKKFKFHFYIFYRVDSFYICHICLDKFRISAFLIGNLGMLRNFWPRYIEYNRWCTDLLFEIKTKKFVYWRALLYRKKVSKSKQTYFSIERRWAISCQG